jgi:hypothetical protein
MLQVLCLCCITGGQDHNVLTRFVRDHAAAGMQTRITAADSRLPAAVVALNSLLLQLMCLLRCLAPQVPSGAKVSSTAEAWQAS